MLVINPQATRGAARPGRMGTAGAGRSHPVYVSRGPLAHGDRCARREPRRQTRHTARPYRTRRGTRAGGGCRCAAPRWRSEAVRTAVKVRQVHPRARREAGRRRASWNGRPWPARGVRSGSDAASVSASAEMWGRRRCRKDPGRWPGAGRAPDREAPSRRLRGQTVEDWKLRTASASLSYVSNTVRSLVIDSRSVMRLVRLSSLRLPPCRLTVV